MGQRYVRIIDASVGLGIGMRGKTVDSCLEKDERHISEYAFLTL
jgi:hypothetical protein